MNHAQAAAGPAAWEEPEHAAWDSPATRPPTLPKPRLLSLDALRGFDLFLLLFLGPLVTELGRGPLCQYFTSRPMRILLDQLDHRSWYGFTFWDLLMPLFMFMAGAAIPYAMARYKRSEGGRAAVEFWLRLARRLVLLWILGMIAQGRLLELSIDKLFLFSNTLQAIAMGYLFASIFYVFLSIPWQIAAALVLLIGYWGLETFVRFGEVTGKFEYEHTLAQWVDNVLMPGHWNPHGIHTWFLSSMTFTVTTMTGVFAGVITRVPILKAKKAAAEGESKSGNGLDATWHLTRIGTVREFTALAVIGVILTGLGLAWGYVPKTWYGYCPLIKNMWTPSMTLLSSGLSFLLLALFYLVIDVRQYRKWAGFLIVIGMNSIAAYMLPYLIDTRRIAKNLLRGLEQYTGDWYEAIIITGGFLVLYFILWCLYRNKKFIRV